MFRILKITLITLLTLFIFSFASTFNIISNAFSLSIPDTANTDRSYLHYDINHHELLRETKNDTLLSRYTLRQQNFKFNFDVNKYSINASWSRNLLGLTDLFNTNYTSYSPKIISNNIGLKTQTRFKEWLIQPGINYSFLRTQDTLFIHDFPRSDITAVNSYFFDLLPETIGDTLPYHNSLDAFQIELLTSKRKRDQNIFFYLSFANTIDRFTESHNNTSSNEKLYGPRETCLTFNYSTIKAQAGWQVNTHSLFWTGINYNFSPLSWKHTIFPNEPDTTEIIQLAHGKTTLFQAQFGYKTLSLPIGLQATLSTGYLTNIAEARTPVLGYVLRILPISHQANLMTTSNYLLTHIHLDYPFKARNLFILPKLDLIATRFWTDISLEALLQFGLEDIDFQQHYIHAIYIASMGLEATISLNSDLFLTFEAEQMIPSVKTVFPITPSPTPSDIKKYGGLSISVGVSMVW